KLLETAIPLFFKVGIDRYMSRTGDIEGWLTSVTRRLPDDPWTGLQTLSAIFLVVLVLSFAFEYARTRLTLLTGQYVMYDLR
ncbi:ABC transporter ATP-binding protein, partial [Acidobacteriia bacterium AH_259_A11_L15]|nr:ABC transporter ATP-binding protein [Acidobacteriia bacterium AH_259_A11_L15]